MSSPKWQTVNGTRFPVDESARDTLWSSSVIVQAGPESKSDAPSPMPSSFPEYTLVLDPNGGPATFVLKEQ